MIRNDVRKPISIEFVVFSFLFMYPSLRQYYCEHFRVYFLLIISCICIRLGKKHVWVKYFYAVHTPDLTAIASYTIWSLCDITWSFLMAVYVWQGECLSPFLFAMYVNDMEQNLTESGIGIPVGDMKISMLF